MKKQRWKAGNMLYPVPVVMVSCQREKEQPNIITVAWAGTISTNPPMVSISIRKERYSHELIKESGEFVINLTTKGLVRAADYCGVKSGREVDKFKVLKLSCEPLQEVKAPGIGQSPVNIPCRVTEIKELGSHDLFLAEVLGVYIEERLLDKKGKFHLNHANLVAYSHGMYQLLGETVGAFGFSVRRKSSK